MSSQFPARGVSGPIAGRYVIEETLGQGGMAKVYRVRDTRTDRTLALKRGWARTSKKAEKRRVLLEREFHTLAQLAHPRIIEVYDYGIDEDGPFYTMELLDGSDLERAGRVPWQQACALLRDVASSLAILHARGLIHRDVSSRNVRCTADGRAKLIDFGAMASMGVAKDVVGTAPFMAPEVLQMQALDARADLFSMGALAYHLLTGRHAYPARNLSELRDLWRSRPAPPHKLVPELPAALSVLVMQLLMLHRSARPQSAAEVMERLCAIGGLPLEERIEVSRAYLATPTLVGRDEVLIEVRRRMLPLVRGDGGTLLIEGSAGSGRSRLLDASALEGKLLGANVLRADTADASRGDFGVARALCAQLVELLPNEANNAARLSMDVLGHVVEGLRGDSPVSVAWPERSLLLRELRDFVLSLAHGRRIVIVVDDVDRIDEPSAALLAALAHKTERHSLVLAVSVERDAESANTVSLQALRGVAQRIELAPFSAEQTAALICSLFGDVPNLHLCAGRIHALSQGNPRTAMELAQQLVNRGLARYAAGSWSLPANLDEHDLPSTLAASLTARLGELSAEARELAYALCLADDESLTLDSYTELTAHADSKRVFRALDELLAARVLVADGDQYRISQRGFLSALRSAMPEAQLIPCHSRMADFLARSGGDLLRRVHHLLEAERNIEAVDLLCSVNLRARLPPLPLLELALKRAEAHALPARAIRALRSAVLNKAPMVLAVESFRRCQPPVQAELERESGLVLLRERSQGTSNERLADAIAATHRRYLETPESERGCSPNEALAELTKLAGACCSFAIQSLDVDFLEILLPLQPLMGLSGSLTLVQQMGEHVQHWVAGRRLRSRQCVEQILARLAQPDHAGLHEMQYNRARLGLVYALGLNLASVGDPQAERHARVLESSRELRVNAWRVRQVLHLNQGNLFEARKCSRRAELAQLQDGGDQSFIGGSSGFELISYCQAGDLLGVKSAIEQVAIRAARCPVWQPLVRYGECYQLWLRDDPKGALELLLSALPRVQPARHPYFCMFAAAHVGLLGALGRDDEALRIGQSYVEICQREQLSPDDRFVYLEVSQILARAGEHRQSLAVIDAAIAEGERLSMAGLSLGQLYEARARIAISMRDRDAFEHYAQLCAQEYSKGKNPALVHKFSRLMEEARKKPSDSDHAITQVELRLDAPAPESAHDTIHGRLLECVDASERARCALTLLLQTTESCAGYLYGVWDREVGVLAGLPDIPAEPELSSWVLRNLEHELDAGATATASDDDDEDAELERQENDVARCYTDQDGRTFQAILLMTRAERQWVVGAVLALQLSSGPQGLPNRELLTEIADTLIEQGDVIGVALTAARETRDK